MSPARPQAVPARTCPPSGPCCGSRGGPPGMSPLALQPAAHPHALFTHPPPRRTRPSGPRTATRRPTHTPAPPHPTPAPPASRFINARVRVWRPLVTAVFAAHLPRLRLEAQARPRGTSPATWGGRGGLKGAPAPSQTPPCGRPAPDLPPHPTPPPSPCTPTSLAPPPLPPPPPRPSALPSHPLRPPVPSHPPGPAGRRQHGCAAG
jgi:hypothetical protein